MSSCGSLVWLIVSVALGLGLVLCFVWLRVRVTRWTLMHTVGMLNVWPKTPAAAVSSPYWGGGEETLPSIHSAIRTLPPPIVRNSDAPAELSCTYEAAAYTLLAPCGSSRHMAIIIIISWSGCRDVGYGGPARPAMAEIRSASWHPV